jgi:hypothetical protein
MPKVELWLRQEDLGRVTVLVSEEESLPRASLGVTAIYLRVRGSTRRCRSRRTRAPHSCSLPERLWQADKDNNREVPGDISLRRTLGLRTKRPFRSLAVLTPTSSNNNKEV